MSIVKNTKLEEKKEPLFSDNTVDSVDVPSGSLDCLELARPQYLSNLKRH